MKNEKANIQVWNRGENGTEQIMNRLPRRSERNAEEALEESEAKYRALLENARDVIVTFDLKGKVTSVNRAIRQYDFREDEIVGKNFFRFVSKSYWPRVLKDFAKTSRGELVEGEAEMITPKGKKIAEYRSNPIKIGGKIIGVQAVLRDVTERKKIEDELKASEEKYRCLFEEAMDAIFVADAETGIILDCNRAATELVDREKSELIGKHQRILHPPEDIEGEFSRTFTQHLKEKEGQVLETKVITEKQKLKDVAIKASIFKLVDKKVIQGIFRDITERKRMDEALAYEHDFLKSEKEKFETLFNLMVDPVVIVDAEGKILEISDKINEITGYEKEELLGKNFLSTNVVTEKSKAILIENLTKRVVGVRIAPYEVEVLTKDGKKRIAEINAAKIEYGRKPADLVIFRDITERKQMEEALRQSEEQARSLLEFQQKVIDTAAVWIDLLDREGNVTLWNRAAELISGYAREEVVGHKKIWEWNYPDPKYRAETFGKVKKVIEKGERLENYQSTIRCKDGTLKTISWYSNNILDIKGEPVGSIAVGVDVTERKKMEEALVQERNFLQALMDNIPDTIYFKDAASRFTRINRAQAELLGAKDPDEAIGKTDFDFFTEEHAQDAYSDEQKIMKTRQPLISKIEKSERPDGYFIWTSTTKVPIEDEGDRIIGMVGISRDVTEQKQMEEALRDSEQKYRTLMEQASIAICNVNITGKITYVNKRFEEVSGYPRDEVVGKNGFKLGMFSDETLKLLAKRMKDRLRGKPAGNLEVQFRCKDGRWIWVEIEGRIIKKRGVPVGFQIISRDITERKQMEEALAHERDFLQALMDNIPDCIYFKGTASRFTRINKAEAELLGIKDPDEAIGKTDFDFFTEEHARDAYSDEQKIMQTGQPLIGKVEKSERPDGYFLWTSTTKVPIKDEKGQVTGTVGISRDITERKQMEEELRRYSEHLEELVEERTSQLKEAQERILKAERLAAIGQTAAMVGHDLRNPLQAIVNVLYLMRQMRESAPQIKEQSEIGFVNLSRTIEQQVEYMNKIVSDLQDYARPLKLEPTMTNLRDLIVETLSVLQVLVNIKVSVDIEDDLELMFDRMLIKRVFMNLILNAIQAMPKGGELTIKASSKKDNVSISFQDTGIGIPEENIPKLFQPLFTTKSKGQGLGLAVCRRMVEAHEGNITVCSEVGKGSTFTVNIPFRLEAMRGG